MKEQFINWLSGIDYRALFAIVAGYLSLYGGILAGLVIGIIKTRITNTKLDEKLAAQENEFNRKLILVEETIQQKLIEKLDDIEKSIITQNVSYQEKRMEAINSLEEDAKEAIEEIKQLSIDDALDKLGE